MNDCPDSPDSPQRAEGRAQAELFTDALMLRFVQDSDIDEVARMWEWQTGPISPEKAREAIGWMRDNHQKNSQRHIHHLCFAVFEKGGSRIIGWCGLDGLVAPGLVALFYSIHTDYQNRGYATACAAKLFEYAFERLRLRAIHSGCDKDNIASFRVMQKAGMSLRGQDKDGDPQFYMDKKMYKQIHERNL